MSDLQLAVLIPYSQGTAVYLSGPNGQIQYQRDARRLEKILEVARSLPTPRLVVAVGLPNERQLARILLEEIDLCTIPDRWLAHIPLCLMRQRANFAAKLAQAHQVEPIRLWGSKETGTWNNIR